MGIENYSFERKFSSGKESFVPAQAEIELNIPELNLSGSANIANTTVTTGSDGLLSATSYEIEANFEYNGLSNGLKGDFDASVSAGIGFAKQLSPNYGFGVSASAGANLDGARSIAVEAGFSYNDAEYTTEGNQVLSWQATATVGSFNGKAIEAVRGEIKWGNDTSYKFAEAAFIRTDGDLDHSIAAGVGTQVDLNLFGQDYTANLETGLKNGAEEHGDIDMGGGRTQAFLRLEIPAP